MPTGIVPTVFDSQLTHCDDPIAKGRKKAKGPRDVGPPAWQSSAQAVRAANLLSSSTH